jgi:hypothetical protein
MVNGQHGIDRACLATAATMLVPSQHLFAEFGEVLPVGALPVAAALAESADIDRGRTAAAGKPPFAADWKVRRDGALPFPSLVRIPRPRGWGRVFRSFSR